MRRNEDVNMRQQTNRLLREQVKLQRQANRRLGCLSGVVFTVLFGVWYWAWLAVKWTVKGAVALGMASWGVLVLASVWTWRGSVVASVWTCTRLVTLARAVYARVRSI